MQACDFQGSGTEAASALKILPESVGVTGETVPVPVDCLRLERDG